MDPDTVSDMLRDALKERRWEDVISAAATLKCWVSMGGFPPAGMSARGALFLSQTMLEFGMDQLAARFGVMIEAETEGIYL